MSIEMVYLLLHNKSIPQLLHIHLLILSHIPSIGDVLLLEQFINSTNIYRDIHSHNMDSGVWVIIKHDKECSVELTNPILDLR